MSVAQFLATSGVRIVAPWRDPGPHVVEGLEVSLRHWVEHDTSEVSAAHFGACGRAGPFGPLLAAPSLARRRPHRNVLMASMTVTDDALAAYPGPIDRSRLTDCRHLRRLQIRASLLVGDCDEPSLHKTLVPHLDRRLND